MPPEFRTRRATALELFATILLTAITARAGAADRPLSFNRDVRPILSANCFACHGFDAKQRKGELRLDDAASAYAERDGHAAVRPRDPEASELVRRILTDDPDTVMPPPSTKKRLTAAEKETLRTWISQGAPFQKHWAFEPITNPPVPAVATTATVRNELDQFLQVRLDAEHLLPQPEADRATLIRRVAFALTGLPPTLAEVEAYEADRSDDAYDKMLQRYLQSPRYGEEMARHWLDVARYADTHGLHLDNERTMWAYRDWVIRSFNANQPFDAFTRDQLAGDLLPQPTDDQLVATGFNRCNVTTSEGGAIEPEWVYRYAVDRTSTMIQTWMGLTGGCAVCHDHKYDPISSREFYSLYAFFYSAADPGMDRNVNHTDPFFKLQSSDLRQRLAGLQEAEQKSLAALESLVRNLPDTDPALAQPAPEPVRIEDIWLDDVFPAGAKTTCSSRNPAVWSTAPEIEPARGLRALKQASAANYQDKFEAPLQPLLIPGTAALTIRLFRDPFEPSHAVMIELQSSRGNRRFHWGDPQRYGKSREDKNWCGELPPAGQWTTLELGPERLDLPAGEALKGVALAQFGGITWWDDLRIAGELAPASDLRASFLAWWKDRSGKDTPGIPGALAALLKAGPPKDSPRANTASESVTSKNDTDDDATRKIQALREFYFSRVARSDSPDWQSAAAAWSAAVAARTSLEESIPGTFVFKDLTKPREAFVMLRGQYDKPGDKVEPDVPAVFPPLPAREGARPRTRRDLAEWLLSPQHPLTARVTVNRFWQQFFGTGLVQTSYDFGSQGAPPSHPELLDWLAHWYREHHWDTKALVRLMLTSEAFRRSSQLTPELLRRDPENRLLARGPRFRLDAEQIRDNALFVSGLINLEMGGRGVNSYQPPNIWEPVGYSDSNTRFYLQDHGADLYRRSIYSFLKRTAPPPFMSNFDGPNREQFCTQRERSNTPLQALQLLNDTQHFEAARALAERLLTQGGTNADERIRFAYRVTLSRFPEPGELDVVRMALNRCLDRYRRDPDAARQAISVGESRAAAGLDPIELAAYTLITNLILNLDETVMRN